MRSIQEISEDINKIRQYLEKHPNAKYIFVGFSMPFGWLSVYASDIPKLEKFPREEDGALVLYLNPESEKEFKEVSKHAHYWRLDVSDWLYDYWKHAFDYVRKVAKERNMVIMDAALNAVEYVDRKLAEELNIKYEDITWTQVMFTQGGE